MEELHKDFNVYEIRSRGEHWELWYPNEGNILTPFKVYDKEGELKSVIWAGADAGKELTKSSQEFSTAKEAADYAKELGAEKIDLIKTKTRKKKAEQ